MSSKPKVVIEKKKRKTLVRPCADVEPLKAHRAPLQPPVTDDLDKPQAVDTLDSSVILTEPPNGATTRDYHADEFIYLQGDADEAVYYIKSGKVKLTVESKGGKQVVLANLGDGSFFGESCLAGQALRTASASAVQRSTVIRVTKQTMESLLQQKPKFAERFRAYLFSRNIQVEADWSALVAREDNTILCIDDEPNGLVVRKTILQNKGFEVLTAESGPDGLKLFADNPVEAVVLDYAMPGMDGGQVAAELKRLNPDIKILLLSAYVDFPEETLRCVDKRSLKGVSPTSFLEDLEKLLSC